MHRKRVLITGAAGGMGRACARLFGASHELVLTDVCETTLDPLVRELESEGFPVVGSHTGDLGDENLLSTLVSEFAGDAPFTLIHTAGLSPSLADWESIVRVNLVATEKLLRSLEPKLQAGTTAILIAS